MTIRSILALSVFLLGLSACSNEESFTLQPLDLSQYGIPVTIQAPDSAIVKKSQIGDWDDITVKKDAYSLQILGKKAPNYSAEKMKEEELATVQNDRVFSKILKEESTGFLFENEIDSVKGYDFRYFYMQGDRVFTFQKGFTDNFTEGQAKQAYGAVKQDWF